MGRIRRLAGLTALAGLIIPPVAAAVAKQRLISMGDEESTEVELVSIFEGRRFASRARGFRGGSVLAWYSGFELDLRDAALDPAGARLQVTSLFSGVQVRVPVDWRIRVDSSLNILSGLDIEGHPAGTAPELVIEARALFSGVQVGSGVGDDDELLPGPGSADLALAEVEAASLATAEAAAEAVDGVEASSEAQGGESEAGDLQVDLPPDEVAPQP
jgi:hypothetical protein